MRHLMNSVVQVYRLQTTAESGRPRMEWLPQAYPLDRVRCRLDLSFVRPGKDIPMPIEAGKAPDRVGVLFCLPDVDLRAGDLLVTQINDAGQLPVNGTFEVRVTPDYAQDFASAHHIEVQVIEASQQLGIPVFPGSV